jgi:hypothetical protein
LIRTFHGFQQSTPLIGIRQNLQLERQFHYSGVYHSTMEGAIPLSPKGDSLLARML